MKEEHLIMEETRNLIEGCLREDRHSQGSLYNLLSKKMFIVCLRYSKNKEEAEEILQEGFMKVFQFIHQYKNTGSFDGWVSKIMVNCALQRYRNKSHLHAIVNIDFVPEFSSKKSLEKILNGGIRKNVNKKLFVLSFNLKNLRKMELENLTPKNQFKNIFY